MSKTTTELVDMSKITKDNVPQLLGVVRDKINAIKKPGENVSTTNGIIDGKDINKMSDITELIKLRSSIKISAREFNNSIKELKKNADIKLISLPTSWKSGKWSEKAWIATIDQRIVEIGQKEKLEKLAKMEEVLSQYESEEQKFQSSMAKFADLLNS